ncbi:MAG: TonB family protein [Pseudomonadota bacterium]|uniref:energy transducer TonB n=1 Tax=Sphingomonas sp. ERG5 TaxID=1381597 RepID=UPI00054B46BB|nr:energy transducer TonB [Sphingomonas sp. ERG5]
MYADRYGKTGIKPGSLTVAIGLNGAILAALIFSTPQLKTGVDTILNVTNIPIDVPPPPDPIKPEIKPKVETRVIQQALPERPVNPDPIMPTQSNNVVSGTTVVEPPFVPGTGVTGTVTFDPPHVAVLTGAVRDPRYAGVFQPTYPAGERRAGNEGRVTVRVLIGTDGRVKRVEKVSAASDAFFEVTERQALSKWRFKPAMRDGVAQESWQTLSVSFVLNEDG